MQIKRLKATDLYIKMLLYGDPGCGKTTLAATAQDHPDLAKVLFLSLEGGLMSIVSRDDIDVVDVASMKELEESYNQLAQGKYPEYRTIVLDSGTEMYNLALREAVQSSMNKRNRGGTRTVDDIELQDYGVASQQTVRLFRAFRDLNRHVIVTAHPKRTYPAGADVATGDPSNVQPAFSPSSVLRLMGMFDMVHFMFIDDVNHGTEEEPDVRQHRALLTSELGVYKAKTRGMHFPQALGQVYYDPTLPEMYELYRGSEAAGVAQEIGSGTTERYLPEAEEHDPASEYSEEEEAQEEALVS